MMVLLHILNYIVPFVVVGGLLFSLHGLVLLQSSRRPQYPTANEALKDSCLSCGSILNTADTEAARTGLFGFLNAESGGGGRANKNGGNVITLQTGRVCNQLDGLLVQAGVTLDCDGYTITGEGGWGVGIRIQGDGVTIRNCVLENFNLGIRVENNATGVLIQSTMIKKALQFGIFIESGTEAELNDVGVIESAGNNIYVDGTLTLDGVTACVSRSGEDIVMGSNSSTIEQRSGSTTTCSTGNGCNFLKPRNICGIYPIEYE